MGPGTTSAPPLAGLRVLDLSRILAGPWCTQLLADLGADVVKVERPGTGDDTRHWGPPWIVRDGVREASYFHACNRSKRSVAIDLKCPEGAERVRRMAARADVLVENFPVGALGRLGLAPETLMEANPRLVACSITGYGQDGPRAAEPGYDAMIQAACGLMSVTGEADGPPIKAGVALIDVMTGLYAANAIQAALLWRERTGRGERIDLALMDVGIATLANQALGALATDRAPGRLGTAHPSIVPYQGFACADGHVMIAVGNDAQFARLCGVLGRNDLADDPDFATNAGRVEGRGALVPALAEGLSTWGRDALLHALAEARVPAGPINDVIEALNDPQVRHRGMPLDMDGVPGVASPVRFAEGATAEPRPSPKLGEHDADVADDPAWR